MSAESSHAADSLREAVRDRYARAAIAVTDVTEGSTSCCSADAFDAPDVFGSVLYDSDTANGLPDGALLASLGCGNPTAVADLHAGDVVLDLGSGGGIDVLLSARRVGPTGYVYGLDMTDEMLDLAERNRSEAGATNVEFLKGRIEDVPLPDESIDVVISNCVINLSADKAAVVAEMFRVLKPGGRIGVSDVVAEDQLSEQDRMERGSAAGCIAGALSNSEYRAALSAVGFNRISIEYTHEVAPEMHGAIITATKPA